MWNFKKLVYLTDPSAWIITRTPKCYIITKTVHTAKLLFAFHVTKWMKNNYDLNKKSVNFKFISKLPHNRIITMRSLRKLLSYKPICLSHHRKSLVLYITKMVHTAKLLSAFHIQKWVLLKITTFIRNLWISSRSRKGLRTEF